MKKICLFFVLCLIASVLYAQGAVTLDTVVSDDSISLKVPLGWKTQYMGSPVLFYILSPQDEGDSFIENITVTKENISNQKLGGAFGAKQYLDAVVENLGIIYADLQVFSRGKDFVVLQGTLNGVTVRQLIQVFLQKDVAYSVCATALPDTYATWEPTFLAIMKTVSVK